MQSITTLIPIAQLESGDQYRRLLPIRGRVNTSKLSMIQTFGKIFGMVLLLSYPSLTSAGGHCPDATQGETSEDCPWAEASRALSAGASSGKSLRATLEKQLPQWVEQLKKDSTLIRWKNLWGKSLNFDEFAKASILDPRIYEALNELFVAPPSADPIVHAGLEHTYGYILSTLKTPYGFKRSRWVSGEIERGFGLPANTFGATPTEGTLFSNVTYFMGRIAARDNQQALRALETHRDRAARGLREFPSLGLKTRRIREEAGEIILQTDLVPFIHLTGTGDDNTHLLIYSVVDPREKNSPGGFQLITAFPVKKGFIEALLKPENFGDKKSIMTKYNAYVPGLTGTSGSTPIHGRRILTKENHDTIPSQLRSSH